MPYSGPDDDSLPSNIKKLDAIKRRAFVAAFNSAVDDKREGESASERESRAFGTANAAAKRAGSKDMSDGDVDEKHYSEPALVQIAPAYAGGATSFGELDRYSEETRRAGAMEVTFSQFGGMYSNIMADPQLTPTLRVGRLKTLVGELGARVDEVDRDPDIAFRESSSGKWPRPIGATLTEPDEQGNALGFDPGTFRAFKDAAGLYRWVAIYSNKFKDREREIFPEQAHREYIEWVLRTKNYPAFRLWHVPYDFGRADAIDYTDEGFMVATGTFAPGLEHVAQNLVAMSKSMPLGCSHGYNYSRRELRDGVYQRYRSFEITALPLEHAANTLTTFGVSNEEAIMLSPQQRPFFEKALGSEGLTALEANLGQLARQAKEDGVDFKSMMLSAFKDDEAAATAEPPAAAATAVPVAAVATPATAVPVAAVATPAVAATVAVAAALGDQTEPVPAAEASPAASTATAPPPASLETQAAEQEQERQRKAFGDMLSGALAPLLQPITERLDQIETQQKALARSDDEKMAALVTPRVGPTGVQPASASDANVLPADSAQAKTLAAEQAAAVAAAEDMTAAEKAIDPHYRAMMAMLSNPMSSEGA